MRDYDAIVLAGGRSERLGGIDKTMLAVDGRPILAHVLAAVAGAGRRIVVGPTRDVGDLSRCEDGSRCEDVLWCRENPPHAGPRAALMAAVPLVRAETVVVLGGDLPAIGPAVPVLLDRLHRDRRGVDADDQAEAEAEAEDGAGAGAAVAVLVDPDGQVNFVAAAWRTAELADALRRAPGESLRALYAEVDGTLVADPAGWGADCDTPADLEAARQRALNAESPSTQSTVVPARTVRRPEGRPTDESAVF